MPHTLHIAPYGDRDAAHSNDIMPYFGVDEHAGCDTAIGYETDSTAFIDMQSRTTLWAIVIAKRQ